MKKFVLLLFISIAVIGLGNSDIASDYDYQTSIEVQENSGNTLNNYQANLSINTSKYIEKDKLDPSCSDIRFEDPDGELLDYWIDNSTCNTENTRVFVKIPEISSYSTELIYMYHGNPGASSGSNPEATMTFYEDFSDGDTSGWGEYGDTGGSGGSYSHSISSQSLYGDHSAYIYGDANCYNSPYDGTDAWYDRNVDLNDTKYVLEFTAKAAGGKTDYSCGDGASPNFYKNDFGEYVGGAGVSCYDGSCSTCETGWGTGKHVIDGSSTSSLSPALRAPDCHRNEKRWFDRIIIRSHVDPAPTYNYGVSEETKKDFCNYRGPFNECIMNSTLQLQSQTYDVGSIFESRSNAVFEAFSGASVLNISNSSRISGFWVGSIKLISDSMILEAGARFKPENGRIILGKE